MIVIGVDVHKHSLTAVAVAVGLGLLGMLLWLLRTILRDSARKPRLRALMLSAFALGLFVLWAASRVVP